MTGASYRLAWATRGGDERLAVVTMTAAGAFAFGLVHAAASGEPSARLAYGCSGIVTAALVAIDFPGAGHARWREFELSLPIAPRERARAGLLLSLGFWMLPLLATCALAELGVFGAQARLPLDALLGRLWVAAASVLLAVALRHAWGRRGACWHTLGLRVVLVAVVVLGFFAPSTGMGAAALLAAAPLFAIAHRESSRVPELSVPRAIPSTAWAPRAVSPSAVSPNAGTSSAGTSSAGTSSAEASTHGTFRRLALRYSLGSFPATALLLGILLWTFGGLAGWLGSALLQWLFVLMWAAQHAGWSARLLRLGHLPFARARLFRVVALPSLVALGIGIGLSFVWSVPVELCRLVQADGAITLRVPSRLWRLTSSDAPVVTSPAGERHQPRLQSFGLGSALVAYNPYDVPPGASRAFLVHQLGRLLVEESDVSLAPEQIEARYLSPSSSGRLTSERYPELTDSRAHRTRIVSAALLVVLVLVVLHIPIRPGRALTAREWRRSSTFWLLAGLYLLMATQQLLQIGGQLEAPDPFVTVMEGVRRQLATHLWLTLLAALPIAVLLYRHLERRFEQMEAPMRSKSLDRWFVEV